MAVRFAVFPAVFIGALALFGFGFYNRFSFLIDVDEQQDRRMKSLQEAQDFRRKFNEGVEQEKNLKKSSSKSN